MTAYGPYRPRPRVLEKVLEELVGRLRQVLVDGVLEDRPRLAPLGGDGGGGGELLLQPEDHVADVAGVKAGDNRFWAV